MNCYLFSIYLVRVLSPPPHTHTNREANQYYDFLTISLCLTLILLSLFTHAAVPRGVEDHEQVGDLLRVHPQKGISSIEEKSTGKFPKRGGCTFFQLAWYLRGAVQKILSGLVHKWGWGAGKTLHFFFDGGKICSEFSEISCFRKHIRFHEKNLHFCSYVRQGLGGHVR